MWGLGSRREGQGDETVRASIPLFLRRDNSAASDSHEVKVVKHDSVSITVVRLRLRDISHHLGGSRNPTLHKTAEGKGKLNAKIDLTAVADSTVANNESA
jgi:hypothetical protein